MYFVVKDHPASLEKIERNGKIVKVLGKGLMKSPGHPSGNQMYYRQSDILDQWAFQTGTFRPTCF